MKWKGGREERREGIKEQKQKTYRIEENDEKKEQLNLMKNPVNVGVIEGEEIEEQKNSNKSNQEIFIKLQECSKTHSFKQF